MVATSVQAVAALSLLVGIGEARLAARSKGVFTLYTNVFSAPECTCNCCIVEGRRPNEVDGQIASKCAVPPPNDERNQVYKCPGKCSIVNDAILGNTNVVHVERYCFYHCQPAGNVRPAQKIANEGSLDASYNGGSIIDTPCVPMPHNLVESAKSSDFNGRDSQVPAAGS